MHISLRLKLALISLLLLIIPFSGFRLAGIVQQNLLESRKSALMFSARAVATSLSGREGLFDKELFFSLNQERDLYLFQLQNPMRLNGKNDDWESYLKEAQHFGEDHLLFREGQFDPKNSGFTYIIGKRGKYIYAFFTVTDDNIVYRQKNSLFLHKSDHLQIGIEDKHNVFRRYIIATLKPGWINGFLLSSNIDNMIPIKNETRIQGVWENTLSGYNIELRIPLDLVGNKLAFSITDVDDPQTRTIKSIIGTANIEKQDRMGWLLSPSVTIEEILKTLNRPRSRIHIVDSNQHIRASYGTLEAQEEELQAEDNIFFKPISFLVTPLFRFFTETFSTQNSQQMSSQPSTLNIQGIQDGLLGASSISTYRLDENGVEVMAAITPLIERDKVIGAVVVEQTTSSILAIKNKVIEESLGLTVFVLLFGGLGLLFFAFRLSFRIRTLRNQAMTSLGKNGQILSVPPAAKAKDEIGDLSRTLHHVLSQLKAQGQYREKMADNLEHEMRTPLAGVSASLKNLATELENQPAHILNYVNWALGDIKRMEELLTAIRDATSLKEALEQGFRESFNLTEAVAMWVKHSWQPTYKEVTFSFTCSQENILIFGDPDRIKQMLDKIIDNGVSFHKKHTPIEILLRKEKESTTIKITNQGPHIKKDHLEDIFDSMVSSRKGEDQGPHLGLGLYISRTIAEHHGGSISSHNIEDPAAGVCFTIQLPHPRSESVLKQ